MKYKQIHNLDNHRTGIGGLLRRHDGSFSY